MRWLVIALVCLAGRALAEEDPDTELARRHFDGGAAAYENRRYEEAARAFEAARRLKPLAAFDFNLGRTYDRMNRPTHAIAAYRRYLESRPADAGEVRARIAVLEARVTPPSVTASPPETPLHRRWWLWTTVAGVVLVGTGVGLALGLTPNDASIPRTTDGNVAARYP